MAGAAVGLHGDLSRILLLDRCGSFPGFGIYILKWKEPPRRDKHILLHLCRYAASSFAQKCIPHELLTFLQFSDIGSAGGFMSLTTGRIRLPPIQLLELLPTV